MARNASTEEELGTLHAKVARVMVKALDGIEKAQNDFENGVIEVPIEPSAPLLGVITKFLNDNKISCVPSDSETLSDLEQRLQKKRQKRAVGNVVHLHDDVD